MRLACAAITRLRALPQATVSLCVWAASMALHQTHVVDVIDSLIGSRPQFEGTALVFDNEEDMIEKVGREPNAFRGKVGPHRRVV